MKKTIGSVLMCGILSVCFAAQAGNYTWDGGGVNAAWATAGNWVGDAVTFDDTANLYWYAVATKLTSYINGPRTIRSINMTANAGAGVGIRLDNNSITPHTLTFSGGGAGAAITTDADAAGALIVGNSAYGDVVLGDNLTITHNGSGALTIARPISGVYAITNNGSGLVVLSTNNTYGGGTTVISGTVQAAADHALGTGGIAVADGATLTLTGGTTNDYINNGAVLILGVNSALSLEFSGEADTLVALSLDGGITWLPDGIYDAAALAALGNGAYSGGGSLRVVEVKKSLDLFLVTSL
jgi:autotransporter-associated beta strand protein